MPQTENVREPSAPMTPLEKALAWHKLQAWRNPHDRNVQHVAAILAELERVRPPAHTTYVVVANELLAEMRDTWSAPVEGMITDERDGRLELVFRCASPRPDPALVERVRQAVQSAEERRFIAVSLDIEDVQHLLGAFGESHA